MSILTQIFSSGATELVKGIGGVIDNLHTSKDEKLAAELKIKELISNYEIEMEKEVTSRWEADMKHGSWLSKNIRPMVIIFLTIIFVILSFADGNMGEFSINDAYKPIYQTLLITVYGAYFAGRSIEKVKRATK